MPHSCRLAALAILIASGCSRRPADDLIATQIKARFFSDPGVRASSLSVAVDKGIVTLSGTVPSAEVQLQAFKLATYTDGVVRISDRMVVVAPPPAVPRPVAAPVAVRQEPRVVSAPAPQVILPPQDPPAAPVAEAVPELRPPGGPRTAANVRIGGLRVPVVAKVPPEVLTAEPEVVYDPGAVIVAATPAERGGLRGLFVVGPPAAASLLERWFADFSRNAPGPPFTYEASGSTSGIQRLIEGRADLSAADAPASDEQIAASRRSILHFPAAVDGVVLVSNLSGVTQELNFSGDVLGAIFAGRITRWNDPALAALNPQTALPSVEILPVHRSDSSGSTLAFTAYLSKASLNWRFGSGVSIGWPAGIGAEGDEGVAALIRQTLNSLGYVDAAYAAQHRLPFGTVRNLAGRAVKANAASLTAAGASLTSSIPADLRASIVNAPGSAAYPIASLTYLLTPERIRDKARRDNVAAFLSWTLTTGQKYAGAFGYGTLPQEIILREAAQIGRVR